MKIPAIRSKIGTTIYYVTTFTFRQVAEFVKKIDDELHKSEFLKDSIQRSITDNVSSIKDYILNQKERFFNSLVLAVYDGDPKWIEVELNFKDEEFFDLGLLEFTGDEKIFPVDGQHRAEGIKLALLKNVDLESEKIGVILISHRKDQDGMRKSRRIFSTLNRYAKIVSQDDIIALDEDDIVAIVTRELLEEFDLFIGSKIVRAQQKAIPETNKTAITSLITLYQCNIELLKLFKIKNKINKSVNDYLKFRPKDSQISKYLEFCINFWTSFSVEIDIIKDYLKNSDLKPASPYRNKSTGGNLIFRPVGLLPFVQAAILIHRRENIDFNNIFCRFNKLDLSINNKPWAQVVWDKYEKKMIMGSQVLTKLLLLYKYDRELLKPGELEKLEEGYASKINYKGNVKDVLKEI